MSKFHVSSAIFTSEGVELSFMELPGDVRGQDGSIIQTRSMAVREDNPAYGDEVRALRDAVTELVEELVEDWPTTDVFAPDLDDQDDDDAEGMGSDQHPD